MITWACRMHKVSGSGVRADSNVVGAARLGQEQIVAGNYRQYCEKLAKEYAALTSRQDAHVRGLRNPGVTSTRGACPLQMFVEIPATRS